MPDVFISYSAKDSEIAQQVYNRLEEYLLEPFLAEISIQEGEIWSEKILKALRSSKVVFFLASSNSTISPYVNQELGIAHDRGKEIVPILIDIAPADLPGMIKNYQALDMRTDNISKLDASIRRIALQLHSEFAFKFISAALITYGVVNYFTGDTKK